MRRALAILIGTVGLTACSHQEQHDDAPSLTQSSSGTGIPPHYRRAYPVAMPVDLTLLPSGSGSIGAARAAFPMTATASAAEGGAAAPASPAMSETTDPAYGALPPATPGTTSPGALATSPIPFVAPTAGAPIPNVVSPPTDADKVVVLDTSFGRIVIELDDFAAPKTCANFRQLVGRGFYNGTLFHRVIPQFVIQGGDPNTQQPDRSRYGLGDPGYTLPPEIKLHHDRGAVAMARQPDSVNPQRYSNGSQFYICVAPCPSLDDQYTVFGHVVAGMDVADRISVQPADGRNDPLERIALNAAFEPRDRALRENASSGP